MHATRSKTGPRTHARTKAWLSRSGICNLRDGESGHGSRSAGSRRVRHTRRRREAYSRESSSTVCTVRSTLYIQRGGLCLVCASDLGPDAARPRGTAAMIVDTCTTTSYQPSPPMSSRNHRVSRDPARCAWPRARRAEPCTLQLYVLVCRTPHGCPTGAPRAAPLPHPSSLSERGGGAEGARAHPLHELGHHARRICRDELRLRPEPHEIQPRYR